MADSEVVKNFCEITGATSIVASHLLEACGGELGAAINLHMQSTSAAQTNNGNTTPVNTNGRSPLLHDEEDDVRAPIAPTSGVLMPHSYSQAHGTSRRAAHSGSVFDSTRDFQSESLAEQHRQQAVIRGHKPTRNGGNTADKKRDLQALFRPPLDLTSVGGFDEVKSRAKSGGQFMLVNVQDMTEFACQALNRDVWSNAAVRDIVANNFLFWQTHTDDGDGARVTAYYKIAAFPFVAIIDPRTGEMIKMVPCNDASVVADTLTSFICDYPTLDTLDEHRLSRQRNNGKHAEQKAERGTKRTLTPTDEAAAVDAKRVKTPTPDDVTMTTVDWESMLGKDERTITLLLRLPSGARHRQSFAVDTPLACVRVWATAMGIEHDKHELIINYPHRSLDDMTTTGTLAECALQPQETLMVRNRTPL